MKKPKYITVDNYLQFKPSEFIRSFVSDIEDLWKESKRTNQSIDLDNFVPNPSTGCLPCIGGQACLNFGVKFEYQKTSNKIAETTADIGDAIRCGDSYQVMIWLENLYPSFKYRDLKLTYYDHIMGRMSKSGKDALLFRVNEIADLIEASGQ